MSITPRQRYNRLWNKVDQYYGQAGAKAPRFRPVGKGKGYAFMTPGKREVSASPNYRRQLVSPKRSARNEARFATLHEWSHIIDSTGEGGANHRANAISRRLNNKPKLKPGRGFKISPRILVDPNTPHNPRVVDQRPGAKAKRKRKRRQDAFGPGALGS